MDDFVMIDGDDALRKAVLEWRKFPELAIDLEMEVNFHHYGVHLALAQVSTQERTWLIDMLAIKDASSLVNLFEDKSILKVFHDVSFDFRILHYSLDCRPRNIFDTKVAAELTGHEGVSLGALLEEYFHLKKDKKWQKADWLKRPLPEPMLAYAARDTAHLLKLKGILAKKLQELGRTSWAQEEFGLLEGQGMTLQLPTCLDIKGAKSLSDDERGRLCALFKVRDELAEKVDRPVFFVLPDRRLLELAKQLPRSVQQWQSLKGVHPVVKRQAMRFFRAVQESKPIKVVRERGKRMTEAQKRELARLGEVRDRIAATLGIASHLVVTRDQMVVLACEKGKEPLKNWQRKVFDVYS